MAVILGTLLVLLILFIRCWKQSKRTCIFIVTRKQQRQNFFQNLLKPNKQNNLFIKIIKFFIYAFKINSHETNYKIINIL